MKRHRDPIARLQPQQRCVPVLRQHEVYLLRHHLAVWEVPNDAGVMKQAAHGMVMHSNCWRRRLVAAGPTACTRAGASGFLGFRVQREQVHAEPLREHAETGIYHT